MVGINALVQRQQVYIRHVRRKKVTFAEFERSVIDQARLHGASVLLIEDKGSGQSLIQNLRDRQPQGVPLPIARTPEGDKRTRIEGVSPMIEAGQLHLLTEASWLGEFKRELLAFPASRHDDQVDALSQLLRWVSTQQRWEAEAFGAPILVYMDDYGGLRQVDEDGDRPSLPFLGEYDPDPW